MKYRLLLVTFSTFAPLSAWADDPVKPAPTLAEVLVTAGPDATFNASTVGVGTFRDQAIVDVPATVNVINRAVLDAQADSTFYDALRNTAGVTRQQLPGEVFDNLAIRGVRVNNSTNFRLNGSLPLFNLMEIPLDNIERLEVLKGVSALYYGHTSPAGVINLVTRRAGAKPNATLGVSVTDHGGTLGSVDVGRRLGEQQQFGLRINAAGGSLQSPTDGVHGKKEMVSAALDWKASERLTLKADLEYARKQIVEQASIALPKAKNGRITLPRLPDATRRISPEWAVFDGHQSSGLLRADYALSPDWILTLETGAAHLERDRAFTEIKNYNIVTGAGTLTGNRRNAEFTNVMYRAEVFGSHTLGTVQHEITLGAEQTNLHQGASKMDRFSGKQNLYDPVALPWLPTSGSSTTDALHSSDLGVYALDRVTLNNQWQAIAGVRYTRFDSEQGKYRYNPRRFTPSAALIYKFSPIWSTYVSYSEGLEQGDRAPDTATNATVALAPEVAKQAEIGMRYVPAVGTQYSVSIFDIDRVASYLNTKNTFVQDGHERNQGIEVSAQGQLLPQFSLQASGQILKAAFRGASAAMNGKVPENTARYTASLFGQYQLNLLPGLALNAGAYYTGPRPVNDLDQAWIGGYTLGSAGVRYQHRLLGKATAWQLNVENLTNKRYWSATGGGRVGVGLPRTAMLSMKVDL
ncbi:TonB-dependent siderophore receptor [Amantichitinum ursilacus]|uniref:Ferrichrome receptor FcuA n=1 Tax=Amantichitinum ursilacus TaxID=857265 RepID=A0A0N0XGN7_9NEIS|nr:TonB-dependent receptor [Amantichitinum ursilacus]KPC50212.1 Ferrichrome receptor FcuA precursor [Amantichitinum ursilacus]